MNPKSFLLIALTVAAASYLVGCGPKEADPEAKVDAPGYYNGPMNPHGTAAKSTGAAKDKPADTTTG